MKFTEKSKIEIPKQTSIRQAMQGEADIVCEILASAFSQDPVLHWMSGHPEIYATLFRAEAKPLYMQHGHVFINETHTGAAMWAPPGVSAQVPLHWNLASLLWRLFKTGGLKSIKRGLSLEKIFAAHHIRQPHYYLHAIGTEKSAQGKGVGSALLQAGIRLCDESKCSAYLESSNIHNNPLYERFGFRITGEVELPDSGPTVWLMLREPPIK